MPLALPIQTLFFHSKTPIRRKLIIIPQSTTPPPLQCEANPTHTLSRSGHRSLT
ncbi:hypothetical protein L873DRAFT_1816874, partial [Choiromyces venosus 120613-1]